MWRTWALWTAATLACCFIALLNSGGYRFGVSDQSSYLPAIEQRLEPGLFPGDRDLIDAQDRLNPFTPVAAAITRLTGAGLSLLAVLFYLSTLAIFFGAALGMARELSLSRWATLGLGLALTLRHRILLTGVNTLESYAHPRMMAFALGLAAILAFLRSRSWLALAFAALAFLIHPTTGLWFGVWLWVALFVGDRGLRRPLLVAALLIAGCAFWMIFMGPLQGQPMRMDERWLRVLAVKDYLFATDWPVAQWVISGLYLALIAGVFLWRLASGRSHPRETALVSGAMTLFLIFVATLPFVKQAVTLIIQLQISRMFWMLDLLATIYAVWVVFEALPMALRGGASRRWHVYVIVLIACLAVTRGIYSLRVGHAGRPLFQVSLPHDDWQDAMAWLGRTPLSTQVLADPGHLWRYGTSVRVSARRDVFLEEVKDAGLAIYSRNAALRIADRTSALGDFNSLTPQSARALAARYGLDFLVTERAMDLPVAYRNPRFTIYRLR